MMDTERGRGSGRPKHVAKILEVLSTMISKTRLFFASIFFLHCQHQNGLLLLLCCWVGIFCRKQQKTQYDVGLAINCLANIATPGLSRDLISDLVQLLGNHKPYVRKKALLAM